MRRAILIVLLLSFTTFAFGSEGLPASDSWHGILFNGNKIGFSHLEVRPESQGYSLRAEAAFRLRFLSVDKNFAMSSIDWVNADLTLRRLESSYVLDGSRLNIQGEVKDGVLITTVSSGGNSETKRLTLNAPLYPAEAILHYPVMHGLAPGRQYRYQVYDGESRQVHEVEQEILGLERSDLFAGEAYKVRTRTQGNEIMSWIDPHGRVLTETMLNGAFISAMEDEQHARAYLASASLNKNELLLDFSRVTLDQPIPSPRQTTVMEIELTGLNGLMLINNNIQQCSRLNDRLRCRIATAGNLPSHEGASFDPKTTLGSSIAVPSESPAIRDLAQNIIGNRKKPEQQINALLEWIRLNIKQEIVDVFSALDVLEKRAAECQGHSYLYAALARSLGIPTRVVNGLVYSEQHQGLLYHTWTESWLDGRWQAVDPTFSQFRADATHLRLLEGEAVADLTPIMQFMGRVKARVVSVQ